LETGFRINTEARFFYARLKEFQYIGHKKSACPMEQALFLRQNKVYDCGPSFFFTAFLIATTPLAAPAPAAATTAPPITKGWKITPATTPVPTIAVFSGRLAAINLSLSVLATSFIMLILVSPRFVYWCMKIIFHTLLFFITIFYHNVNIKSYAIRI
jgi:hypothetical protein